MRARPSRHSSSHSSPRSAAPRVRRAALLAGAALIAAACSSGAAVAPDGAASSPRSGTSPSASPTASPRPGGGSVRDALADRARRLPHQGESDVRQPVRDVSGGRRRHRRDGRRRAPAAAARHRGQHRVERHPALLSVFARGVEPREDGRLQSGRRLRPVGLHAAPSAAASQLLGVGAIVRAGGQLLLLGAGPVVPESPLLHRRTVGGRARQPQARPRRTRQQHVRLRRAARADGRDRRHRGPRQERSPVLRFPDRGRPPLGCRHPLVLLRGGAEPARLHLVRLRRHPAHPRDGRMAQARAAGRRGHRPTSARTDFRR